MRRPRVTVAVPTFERADLLAVTLRSVLAQTLTELEVVVCDNASRDHTAEVVAAIDDPRVRYHRHDTNLGIHANLTFALRQGSASLLVLCQDDDVMAPDNLARKAAVLERHADVAFVHSAFDAIDETGRRLAHGVTRAGLAASVIEAGDRFVARSLDLGCRHALSSVMWRRAAVADERFDPADGGDLDFAFSLRAARHGRVAYLAEPLVSVRFHAGSAAARQGLLADGRDDVTEALRPSAEQVRLTRHTKRRFLAGAGARHDRVRTRRLVRRSARRDLHALLTRGRVGLAEAARVEPTVAASPMTLVALGLAHLPPLGRDAARRVYRRARRLPAGAG